MRILWAGLVVAGMTGLARGEEILDAEMLALQVAAHRPEFCIGFERVEGLNDKIVGEEAMAKARESWEALARVIAEQTDYEAEFEDANFLIRPKSAPKLYDAPFVTRRVRLTSDPAQWKTLAEAVSNMRLADGAQPAPFLTWTSANGDFTEGTKILPTPGTVAQYRKLVEAGASNVARLSDVLFELARLVGARSWTYGPIQPYVVGRERARPWVHRTAYVDFYGNIYKE